jgi:hypothetical protein
MPIHDWTRVPAGLFHDFHQRWTVVISDVLNDRLLPEGYSALLESRSRDHEPDVMTIEALASPGSGTGGIALASEPKTRIKAVLKNDREFYARKANRIVIRNEHGIVVAVIEVVSPGNKSSKRALREFLDKSIYFLENEVNLLVIDLLPPTRRDPQGIHAAIWNELSDESFSPPADKPLTLAAYSAMGDLKAFIEPVAVGDTLPDLPLFIAEGRHVPVPMEKTYSDSWQRTPAVTKQVFSQ